jgi:hypothetical protein
MYEITEHAAGRSSLRVSDRSRFSTVRLTVTRDMSGTGTVSVIVRDVQGGVQKDTRLATATISLRHGTPGSRDAVEALRLALHAVLGTDPA